MMFEYLYAGNTAVTNGPNNTGMSFVPDASRSDPVAFRGNLSRGINFREAISALHDVVVSDLRYKPKDRDEYKAWVAQQEQADLLQVMAQGSAIRAEVQAVRSELDALNRTIQSKMGPFYNAQRKYFDYLYRRDMNAWYVLDPVITVHPDQVFFECFSVDESTYGCMAASYEEFTDLGEFSCGTTNVDYSATLYDEFQKIRTYKTTTFEVDPAGFEVQTTGEESHREVKIDLPDTWVRGFLQVSSAMTMPATTLKLHPLDVFNFCSFLRRNRESKGPRSMKYKLTPGQPIVVEFEPFGHEVVCSRSPYLGSEAQEIRVWGRRRLHILERLIPVAKSFTVHLLGKGMPSFYIADLGSMSFTLGLSGWTANDWSKAGNFDLMAPRAEVDGLTRDRVFAGLKETWFSTPEALATKLGLDKATVMGAMGIWTQCGRAIYDMNKGVYRIRELSKDPLPMDKLRFANEREESATAFLDRRQVQLTEQRLAADGMLHLSGRVRAGRTHDTTVVIDNDERIRKATCTCNFHFQNKLFKGPCEHILATRMASSAQIQSARGQRA